MFKQIITIACIFISGLSSAYAEKSQYIDLSKFLSAESTDFNDIAYLHLVPKYEENPDPKKAVTMEVFFLEYDNTPQSHKRLKHIKEIIEDDKRLEPKFQMSLTTISNDSQSIENSKDYQDFLKTMELKDKKVFHDQIPSFLDASATLYKKNEKDRYPSSFEKLSESRKFISVVRLTSSMGGTFVGLYFMKGISPGLATVVSFWPGLASGALSYYSNAFGAFMTSERWANWLMESDNYFAKETRKSFGLNHLTLKKSLERNSLHFQNKYPTLYKQNPGLFEKDINASAKLNVLASKDKLSKILSRLRVAEEYIRSWVAEAIFVTFFIQAPQAIAGISKSTGIIGASADIVLATSAGFLAQGPGELAMQIRKYQMIDELKAGLLDGTIKHENHIALLEEIEKVLAKDGEFKHYLINDKSHAALRKIEQWARVRATFLSFFAVAGVGLQIAGVPLATPLLIAVGTGGAVYYANVKGWIEPRKISKATLNYIKQFKIGNVKHSMKFLSARFCSSKFLLKPQ